jgi:hypothetical protein
VRSDSVADSDIVEAAAPSPDEGSEGSAAAPAAVIWTLVTPDTVPADVVARADAARAGLAGTLLGTLTRAIAERGHAGAVTTCHDAAPQVTADVSREHNVRIGRTSFRIRNTDNTAPDWARLWVEGGSDELRWVQSDDGRWGELAPIRVSEPCLACHGLPESIAPDVRTAITTLYPNDQAFGFADGDLRGYIWVELAASVQ